MNMPRLTRVVGGRRYDTETGVLLAHDVFWDGHNFERQGRNTWLLRTQKGNYFAVHGTLWQGEYPTLEPLEQGEAVALYEHLPEHVVEWAEAFPTVTLEEA